MEPLFKDSIKVHFAGAEAINKAACLNAMGVKYFLFTCYPFVLKRMKGGKKSNYHIPRLLESFGNHVIMDSGLFTLMFGSAKGKKDKDFLYHWMHELVEFVKETGFKGACVEVDCQKILSPAAAWEFRIELKDLLPKNRIINVFHLEDGPDGLDRLIEFSDYIAISVPELRIHKGKTYKKDVKNLTRYIKSKKPEIDIHLLGCTEMDMLKENKFCTSSDSTTWSAITRWPDIPLFINGKRIKKHISQLNEDEIIERYQNTVSRLAEKYRFSVDTKHKLLTYSKVCLAGEAFLHEYDYLLGFQR